MHDNICEPYQGPCRVDKRGEDNMDMDMDNMATWTLIMPVRHHSFNDYFAWRALSLSVLEIYLIVRDEVDASTLWTKKWLRTEPINKTKSRLGLYTYLSSVTDKTVIFCFIN